MSELESLALRATELSSKVDFWNNAVLVALFVTALAAAAIVVAQRKAFLRQGELDEVHSQIAAIKEHQLALDLLGKDQGIAEAKRGSDEANATATKAKEGLAIAEQHAAEANERASQLDLKAEQLRKDNLELEAASSPRVFKDQLGAAARLKALGEENVILEYSTEDEVRGTAEQIAFVLNTAGWKFTPVPNPNIESSTTSGVGAMPNMGVTIVGPHEKTGPIVEEFKNDGVSAFPMPGRSAMIFIQVGPKPNPALKRMIDDVKASIASRSGGNRLDLPLK